MNKMKQKFLMAALAAMVLFAGCKDDEEPKQDKPEDGD